MKNLASQKNKVSECYRVLDKFKLDNKVVVITGGAGLLGKQHSLAVAEAGGIPILWDINKSVAIEHAEKICQKFKVPAQGMGIDITDANSVKEGLDKIIKFFHQVDILINNAANDPKIKKNCEKTKNRFENFTLDSWHNDIAVGLTGAFICSQVIGTYMAEHKGGIILNIASDLGIIAPDQRIYRQSYLAEEDQPAKPVSYSVIKHGIIGLTKYLATYWSKKNIRVNALCPGGIYNDQPKEFVDKLIKLIPMNRMAFLDEYNAAVIFLCSEASSYVTGSCLVADGGRTSW